jgi:hypothetical protein
MKMIIFFLLMTLSLHALAWNELECDGLNSEGSVRFEVQQSFPRDSYFKQARLWTRVGGSSDLRYLTVSMRNLEGFGKVEYSAPGLRIEVDHWPDQTPRWGWTYRGTLQTNLNGRYRVTPVNCRFPSAQ